MTFRQMWHICGSLLNIAVPLGMLTANAIGTFHAVAESVEGNLQPLRTKRHRMLVHALLELRPDSVGLCSPLTADELDLR